LKKAQITNPVISAVLFKSGHLINKFMMFRMKKAFTFIFSEAEKNVSI